MREPYQSGGVYLIMGLIDLFKKAANFIKDENAVTAIEYGIITALIILVCITPIRCTGWRLSQVFDKIADTLN